MKRGYVGLLALLVCADVAAAVLIPAGPSFQVNTYTTGDQRDPAIGTDRNGNFLIVWRNGGQIAGQLYDATASPLGTEMPIAPGPGVRAHPAVIPQVVTPYVGGFNVAWNSLGQDGDQGGIYTSFVSADGSTISSEVRVNRTTTGDQSLPAGAVLHLGGGSFPVPFFCWNDDRNGDLDIYGNIQGPFGFQPSDFTVSLQAGSDQESASADVAAATGVPLVVVWHSGGSAGDGDSTGVFGLRYGSTGTPLGTEFQVNTNTTGLQLDADVAVHPDGAFVVVWNSEFEQIAGQRFDSAGALLGTEFQIGSGNVSAARVASDEAGGFAVVWHDFDLGMRAQRFDANAAPQGDAVSVFGSSNEPDIDRDGGGGFVVVTSEYDGYYLDIWAQRFVDATVTPTPTGPTPTPTATPAPNNCPLSPAASCRTPGKSVLLLKDSSDNTKNKLIWKWIRGTSTTDTELGDPSTSRAYAFCVYDGTGRLLSANVPAHATKWTDLKYKDPAGTADGIQKVILKPGATNNTKILVKGRGDFLPDITLGAFTLPLRAQLVNDETSLCFEATYAAGNVIKNDAAQFKAKTGN